MHEKASRPSLVVRHDNDFSYMIFYLWLPTFFVTQPRYSEYVFAQETPVGFDPQSLRRAMLRIPGKGPEGAAQQARRYR